MIAYRIVQREHALSAMSGKGAKEYGGRWNNKGRGVVYLAQTLSLATLEILVHLPSYSLLSRAYVYFAVTFDPSLVQVLDHKLLPANWKEPEIPALKRLGDQWLAAAEQPILQVPSAVSPGENLFLLNPLHEDAMKVQHDGPHPMQFDPRLLK